MKIKKNGKWEIENRKLKPPPPLGGITPSPTGEGWGEAERLLLYLATHFTFSFLTFNPITFHILILTFKFFNF